MNQVILDILMTSGLSYKQLPTEGQMSQAFLPFWCHRPLALEGMFLFGSFRESCFWVSAQATDIEATGHISLELKVISFLWQHWKCWLYFWWLHSKLLL